MDSEKLRQIKADNAAKELANIRHEEELGHLDQIGDTVLSAVSSLIKYLEGQTTKTEVVNQLESIATPDVEHVVKALQILDQTIKATPQTDLSGVTALMQELVNEAKQLPKTTPDFPELPQPVDNTKQLEGLKSAIQAVEKVVKAQKLVAEAPVVNVPETTVNVDAPDLQPLQQGFKDVVKAVKAVVIPEYKTDNSGVEKLLKKTNKLLDEILDKPVGGGGGGGGSGWSAVGPSGNPAPTTVDFMGSERTTLYDAVTNATNYIDSFRNLRVVTQKRLIGSNTASIDANLYTTAVSGTGAATADTGLTSLTTGTTANSSVSVTSKGKARYLSSRANVLRIGVGLTTLSNTNNVTEFGLYIDASNAMLFRYAGGVFSCVLRRAGTETVVSSGSFNGNGTQTNVTYTPVTAIRTFEIVYSSGTIRMIVSNVPVHTFTIAAQSLVSSFVGQLYISNANSGGSTSNIECRLIGWSVASMGDAINNPGFYNCNAVAETRTLKAGGGTLQSISIGRSGGANATLTVYDNSAGSGTIIGIWDLNATQSVGTHPMGVQGVNFNTGLTYVTSGTMTNASVTFFYD